MCNSMNHKIGCEGAWTVWRYNSPVGMLLLGEWRGRIVLCDWVSNERKPSAVDKLTQRIGRRPEMMLTPTIQSLIKQLDEYFEGRRMAFDVTMDQTGTEFQRRVWGELGKLGYGETITYGELAKRLNCKCVRAVASAVGANPTSILVPCHRVRGAGGKFRGYAGGVLVQSPLLSFEEAVKSACGMRKIEKLTLP